jgi:hypothetical protein
MKLRVFIGGTNRRELGSGVAGDRGSVCVILSCRQPYVDTVYCFPCSMTRYWNFLLNILQRNWSFVAKQPEVLVLGLQTRR